MTFSTLVCASVAALYAMIQPVYGSMSQCDVHAVIDAAVQQEKRRSLLVLLRIEDHGAAGAAGARARKRGLDRSRPAEQLGARA